MEKLVFHLKSSILYLIIFLFPLFFLPITQEFYLTNKLYLLSFGLLVVVVLLVVQLFLHKKIELKRSALDVPVLIFFVVNAVSVVFSSPNKIQGVLNLGTGLLPLAALVVLYFLLTQLFKKNGLFNLFSIPILIVSAFSIIAFLNPFAKLNLPAPLLFLKTFSFNLLGDTLTTALFLGFFVVVFAISFISFPPKLNEKASPLRLLPFVVILLAFFLNMYQVVKAQAVKTPPVSSSYLAPFSYTWYSAVEALKQPREAVFGVGPDNFSSVYNRVKPAEYNQTPLWNIGEVAQSRSYVLGLWAETGLLGLLAFGLLLFVALKEILSLSEKGKSNPLLYLYGYLVAAMFFFPPSLPVLFLFFLTLATVAHAKEQAGLTYDLQDYPLIYGGAGALALVLVIGATYLLGRSYLAEWYFKKSLDGLVKNNAKIVYDNMRQAAILNPYIERFRSNFSQVNLLIANNIASKPQDKLTDQDRQNITQAIQAAIAEAKAAVALNPQKASSWENLSIIYRNVINIAQGAEIWAISSYQRAILLDPQNPVYRLNLGGIYYSLGSYDEALKFFEQAVILKPDWANANYNFAWASYQKGNYQQAVNAIQNAITLIDPQKDRTDFEKAQTELEMFKTKLPKQEPPATESAQPSTLTLPTPQPTLEPKIQLPKSASPEAK
jgi:tetratricopeptide (TPR) repeat protein